MTRILEVEEDGTLTLPADVLGHARPHTRYVLETNGSRLILQPEPAESAKPRKLRRKRTLSPEEWEKERQKLTEKLSKVWPKGVPVVDVISEMRR